MLGMDDALFRDDVPGRIRPLLQLQHPIVLDDLRATLPGRRCVSPDRASGVDIALAVGPHAADHPLDIDDGAEGLDLLRRHQPHIVDADRLEAAVVGLKPFPALRGGGDVHAAGHVHADRLARFGFDLLEEVDRIGLQNRHVGIGVQGVKAAGCVPGGACGQDRPLDEGDVRPAQSGKMVKDRGAHHAAPDHDCPVMRRHAILKEKCGLLEGTGSARPSLDRGVQFGAGGRIWTQCGFCRLVDPPGLRVRMAR